MPKKTRRELSRAEYRASLATKKDGANVTLPQKHFYRQRAHANPFADHALVYPKCPASMDWSELYPAHVGTDRKVEVVDIGCGFGGLLFALSPKLPETLILGMEIRTSVTEFVNDKIQALRKQAASTVTTPSGESSAASANYQNISVLRANSMKFLPNFFTRAQLSALFFCFPDPHFKARKHKARIVSPGLVAEYAYVLRPNGLAYTITDVKDLHEWMRDHFDACALFERVLIAAGDEVAEKGEMSAEEELCVALMMDETEEGKKVARNNGCKYVGVWRRKADPEW